MIRILVGTSPSLCPRLIHSLFMHAEQRLKYGRHQKQPDRRQTGFNDLRPPFDLEATLMWKRSYNETTVINDTDHHVCVTTAGVKARI